MILIRLILIIMAIYFGYHLIIKPLLRMLLQGAVQKMVDEQFKNQQAENPKKGPEGSIHIDYIPTGKNKKATKEEDKGEYIDYEEIK